MFEGKHKPTFKFWLEYEGKPILGKGGAEILRQIGNDRSISKAAKSLGMSYRFVWNYLNKVEKALGEPVAETHKGGKSGGGGATLTELGKSLLGEYNRLDDRLTKILLGMNSKVETRLEINAKNRLKGKVTAIEKSNILEKVKVEVTTPVTVTAIISKEDGSALRIEVGEEVEAIVKATEIMIAK